MAMQGDVDQAAEQRRARIAWYYFVGGLTQQEISNRLGLTRARVNRILAACRADGMVRVEIHSPFARAVELEHALVTRFGLTEAVVAPVPDDPETLQQSIGHAAAGYVASLARPGMTLGVGWGQTLGQCVNVLRSPPMPGMTVVSLMGGLTRGSSHNTFELASRYAEAFGAESLHLAAPIYVEGAAVRQTLLSTDPLRQVQERALAADLAVISVGDLSGQSLLCRVDTVASVVDELRQAGAVGDVLAHFLDAEGREVDHPLNRRAMAMAPDGLRRIGHTVAISGGAHKVPILRAVLTAGYINALVTDEATAQRLIEG
ncbi:MAG: sugar-binding transcriptional regulator [Rhodospirillaceae bacterium]|nr:sugar-binding transcriptional regulator [Rhodospirillaceae bacterium]